MVALVIEWMESRIGLLRSAEDGRAVVPHCVNYLVQLKRLSVLLDRFLFIIIIFIMLTINIMIIKQGHS